MTSAESQSDPGQHGGANLPTILLVVGIGFAIGGIVLLVLAYQAHSRSKELMADWEASGSVSIMDSQEVKEAKSAAWSRYEKGRDEERSRTCKGLLGLILLGLAGVCFFKWNKIKDEVPEPVSERTSERTSAEPDLESAMRRALAVASKVQDLSPFRQAEGQIYQFSDPSVEPARFHEIVRTIVHEHLEDRFHVALLEGNDMKLVTVFGPAGSLLDYKRAFSNNVAKLFEATGLPPEKIRPVAMLTNVADPGNYISDHGPYDRMLARILDGDFEIKARSDGHIEEEASLDPGPFAMKVDEFEGQSPDENMRVARKAMDEGEHARAFHAAFHACQPLLKNITAIVDARPVPEVASKLADGMEAYLPPMRMMREAAEAGGFADKPSILGSGIPDYARAMDEFLEETGRTVDLLRDSGTVDREVINDLNHRFAKTYVMFRTTPKVKKVAAAPAEVTDASISRANAQIKDADDRLSRAKRIAEGGDPERARAEIMGAMADVSKAMEGLLDDGDSSERQLKEALQPLQDLPGAGAGAGKSAAVSIEKKGGGPPDTLELIERYINMDHPRGPMEAAMGMAPTKPEYRVAPGDRIARTSTHIQDVKLVQASAMLAGGRVNIADEQAVATKAMEVITHYAGHPKLREIFLMPYHLKKGMIVEGAPIPKSEICRVYAGVENFLLELYDELPDGGLIDDASVDRKIDALLEEARKMRDA